MGSRLLAEMIPHLAGRVSLSQFVAIALVLGVIRPPGPLTPEALDQVLQEEAGNVSAAARRLGVCTKTIYRHLRRLRVRPAKFRPPGAPPRGFSPSDARAG